MILIFVALLIVLVAHVWWLESRIKKLEHLLSEAGLRKSIPDAPRIPPPPVGQWRPSKVPDPRLPPVCVNCGRKALSTAAHIPVCEACFAIYQHEARQYLPENERTFYSHLQEKASYEN